MRVQNGQTYTRQLDMSRGGPGPVVMLLWRGNSGAVVIGCLITVLIVQLKAATCGSRGLFYRTQQKLACFELNYGDESTCCDLSHGDEWAARLSIDMDACAADLRYLPQQGLRLGETMVGDSVPRCSRPSYEPGGDCAAMQAISTADTSSRC